ncbi:MAG: nucleotidyltransferase family protein [Anaerolineales bacterium]
MGVQSLAVFGSVARGEETAESDVDILVSFSVPVTFDTYFDTKIYLEDLLGRQVDLGSPQLLRERVKPYIEKDAIYVLA